VLGLKTLTAVKPEHIADLRGLMQSLTDGDATPENTFKSLRPETLNIDKTNDKKERTRILKQLEKCDTLDEIEILLGSIPNIADYAIADEIAAQKEKVKGVKK